MTDLVSFLRERLDEDEQVTEAAHHQRWRAEENFLDALDGGDVARFEFDNDAGFVGEWHPSRVLAEVAAKRSILTRVHHAIEYGSRGADIEGVALATYYVACSCGWERELAALKDWDLYADPHLDEVGFNEALRDAVVRALVAPYGDHPDFDPSWAS